MIKVGFIGGPGAGKSTLAASIFSLCKRTGISSELVQEFVREELNRGWQHLGVADQFRIMLKQREREDIIPDIIDVVLTDSPTILAFIYAPRASLDLEKDVFNLSALYEEFVRDLTRYDLLFYVVPMGEMQADGTRKQSQSECDDINSQILALLDLHRVPYIEVEGSDESIPIVMEKIKCLLEC